MNKIFWGLFFIVAGVFVVINQLGYYTNIGLFSLLCTIFLIPILIKSIFKVNFAGILFSLAFLCIIYREPLNLEAITPIPVLLTALLGSIGLSILFSKNCFFGSNNCGDYNWKNNKENFEQVINGTDSDEVNLNVSFGSTIKYVNSDDFKRANLRSSFGSMVVYFDNTKITGDNAIINLDISFSGVELYIPKDWKIINKVNVSLGSVEQKNRSAEKTEKTVTLTGTVNLSGVEIIFI